MDLYFASSSLFSIFVPPTTNALRDILLSRSITGESPVKKRFTNSEALEFGSGASEKRKVKNTKAGSGSSRVPTHKSEASKRKATLSAADATKVPAHKPEGSRPPVAVAGPCLPLQYLCSGNESAYRAL